MSERLFIRLGKNLGSPCAWVVWSEQEQEIIASGELADARSLETLAQRAGNRPVDVLVPASALQLTSVNLPEKGQRQALKALPFLLEDTLAQNVDELHFVVGPRDGESLSVAVVAHEQMQNWLSWLDEAGLKVRKMVPDCLALEREDCDWALMAYEDQLLLRTGEGMGMSMPKDWLQPLLPGLLEEQQTAPSLACYTEFQRPELECRQMPLEMPMLVLAKGLHKSPINLLSGPYVPKREYSKHLLLWKRVAIVAAIALLLGLVNKGLNIHQMQTEADELRAQSESIYRQVVPGSSRIVNLRSQLESQLRTLQGSGSGGEFFAMLDGLEGAFKQVPDLKPNSLRFDAGRSEIRMQVTAKSYAQIEQFKELAGRKFRLEGGAMNSTENAVTSTLTLRSK
ncbi:MAG: type II secretion system protein GspL [Shewanella algae]